MLALLVVSTLVACAQQPVEPPAPPNIIVVLADDLGYGDVGVYGSRLIQTPNIDALANEGVLFTAGYVAAAVCSPSRAALMTGRYPQRFGYHYNNNALPGLPLSERILPEYLKDTGYATGIVGKWQLGMNEGQHPLDRGFDEFFGLASGSIFIEPQTEGVESWNVGPIPERRARPVLRGREVVEEDEYLTDAFTREALSFIDRHSREPFFLYLAHYTPHVPLQATARYLEQYRDVEPVQRRIFAAMVSSLDESIGRITARLQELGISDNTLILFLSDNGCALYTQGACSNAPLAGGKRYQHEGGVRVPFLLKWPDKLPSGLVFNHPVSAMDVVATAVSASGQPVPANLDGVDLEPFLAGNRDAPHDQLFWRAGPNQAVRAGNWKLWKVNKADPSRELPDMPGALLENWAAREDSPFGQLVLLYDLSRDVGEHRNLAADHPDKVAELETVLDAWNATVQPPSVGSNRGSLTTIDDTLVELVF